MPDIFKNVQVEVRFNGHLVAHGEFPFDQFTNRSYVAQYGEHLFGLAIDNAREQLNDEQGQEGL